MFILEFCRSSNYMFFSHCDSSLRLLALLVHSNPVPFLKLSRLAWLKLEVGRGVIFALRCLVAMVFSGSNTPHRIRPYEHMV